MTHGDIIEETQTHRVLLVPDDSPCEPDEDYQGVIVQASPRRWSGWRTEVRHHDGAIGRRSNLPEPLASRSREAPALANALDAALNHAFQRGLEEMAFAERYLRVFYDVVSFGCIEWGDDKLICIVTRDMAAQWGVGVETFPKLAE